MERRQKVSCTFKQVPGKTKFYVKRRPDVTDADSISFWKESEQDNFGFCPEFGNDEMHPDQPCWYYVEK